jgi:CBS domain-containing protein
MWEYDCGIVPIVNRLGRLSGVVTDRDFCMAAYSQGQPLGAIAITSPMTKNVVSCHASHTIESMQKLMRDPQILPVAVVDGGSVRARRPVGGEAVTSAA